MCTYFPWKLLLRRNLLLKIYFVNNTPKVVLHTAVNFLFKCIFYENLYPLLKFKVEMYLEKISVGEKRGIVQCFSVFWLVIFKKFSSPLLLH